MVAECATNGKIDTESGQGTLEGHDASRGYQIRILILSNHWSNDLVRDGILIEG